jgi:hypothetical protein
MSATNLAVVPKADKQKSSGVPGHYLILQAIMADTELSFAAKSAATVMLLLFQNRKTGQCNPSYDAIAERMGGSRRTAIRAAAELVKAGYLSWEGTRGGTSNHTNRYVFRIPRRDAQPSEAVPDRQSSVPNEVSQCAKSGSAVCQIRSGSVPTLAHEPDRTKYNQILSAPVADAPSAVSEKFEEFWKVYPSREGANPKKPAEEKFLSKVKAGADLDEIIAGAKRLATDKNVGTRFIPMAQTWPFQERWKDNQPSLQSPSSVVHLSVVPKMSMEEAVAQFAKVPVWSRYAPVSDPSQAPPELMAKYGMLPDGRKLPKGERNEGV